jgi:hypothetical protein
MSKPESELKREKKLKKEKKSKKQLKPISYVKNKLRRLSTGKQSKPKTSESESPDSADSTQLESNVNVNMISEIKKQNNLTKLVPSPSGDINQTEDSATNTIQTSSATDRSQTYESKSFSLSIFFLFFGRFLHCVRFHRESN